MMAAALVLDGVAWMAVLADEEEVDALRVDASISCRIFATEDLAERDLRHDLPAGIAVEDHPVKFLEDTGLASVEQRLHREFRRHHDAQLICGVRLSWRKRVGGRRNAVSLAFCWSHVRRKFYELAQSGPAPIATEALARIAELYRIENEIRGRSPEERRAARQERSRPIIDALQPWLREKLALVSQKSKLAEAIRYALARWAGPAHFLDDGRVEIDSNVVERSIRPIALNRKNALFAGSDGGGEHWATIASLIETCKLNGIDPYAYLADVITRIVAGHPQNKLYDLLPWAYAPAPLKAVA